MGNVVPEADIKNRDTIVHIPQYMWDIITCPYHWYLFLGQHFWYVHGLDRSLEVTKGEPSIILLDPNGEVISKHQTAGRMWLQYFPELISCGAANQTTRKSWTLHGLSSILNLMAQNFSIPNSSVGKSYIAGQGMALSIWLGILRHMIIYRLKNHRSLVSLHTQSRNT